MTATYVPDGPFVQVRHQRDAMFGMCDECGTVFTDNQYWGWHKHMHLHQTHAKDGHYHKRATYWAFQGARKT